MVKTKNLEKFKIMYRKQLSKLDPHKVAKDLEGRILLCYENIYKKDSHCHREIVAEWLREAGYKVKELPAKIKKVKKGGKAKNRKSSVGQLPLGNIVG